MKKYSLVHIIIFFKYLIILNYYHYNQIEKVKY